MGNELSSSGSCTNPSRCKQMMEVLKVGMLKEFKAPLDAYIQKAKREHLSLKMANFVKSTAKGDYAIVSKDSVNVPGARWKLGAIQLGGEPGRLHIKLGAGFEIFPINFEVDYSIRLLNSDSTKNICKQGKKCLEYFDNTLTVGHLMMDFADIKDLTDQKKGFLRKDGSIQLECDFTIVNAKVEGLSETGEW